MRKGWILILLASLLGCGGSSGGSDTSTFGLEGDPNGGNFIATTVDVERRFIYTLNRGDNTLTGVFLPEEEGGHHHHGRILAQAEEEEGLEFEELDGSPYNLGAATLLELVVDSEGRYLYVLDTGGRIRIYQIDGVGGLLTLQGEFQTLVANPRLMRLAGDGSALAVLGDSLVILELNSVGALRDPARINGTSTWVDVALNGRLGAASTNAGAQGFAWTPGALVTPTAEVALPGATRGNPTYLEDSLMVVNRAAASASQLTQAADGALTLTQTLGLPAGQTDPQLILALESPNLLFGDTNSLALVELEAANLREIDEVTLTQAPISLFSLPETEFVLVGHGAGQGSSYLHAEEDELELSDEPGPGGNGTSSFGFAERDTTVTQVTRI